MTDDEGLHRLNYTGSKLVFKYSVFVWVLCHHTHIFVVLLEVDELLLQGFDLALQVHAAHVGVIDELPQANDVGLHRLADGQLRLVSERGDSKIFV